jgi:hypothetical protein
MLFAMDKQWWEKHHEDVALVFKGERISSNPIPMHYGVRRLPTSIKPYSNSGAACISIAINSGAETVIMLGYDCQHTEGRTHWHGSHPKGLGDAGSVKRWPARFEVLKREIGAKAKIINASRVTALAMFDRQDLETCLAHH